MRPARKTSGLAALLLFAFALVFGATQPAAADPRLQTVSPCAKVTLSLNFNGVTGANCAGGVRFQSPTLLPGWTFTRASPETCQWASGDLTYAASGQPCITDLGMGVWESRTNLLPWSQAFDNAAWVKTTATVTPDAAAAPDGTLTADKLVETAATANHLAAQTITVVSATQYAISVDAKAAERTFVAVYEGALGKGKFFNLTNGTVGGNLIAAPDSASIQPLSGGWYRCTIVVTTASTVATPSVYLSTDGSTISYLGVAGSGAYVWAGDTQAGAFPTPYIPTTTVAVTRAADVASIAFAQPPAATIYAEWTAAQQPTQTAVWSTTNPYIHLAIAGASTTVLARAMDSGFSIISVINAGNGTGTGVNKNAYAFQDNDYATSLNGAAVGTATGTPIPTGATGLFLGQWFTGGGTQLNGYMRMLSARPSRLPNAQLRALTQ